MSTPRRLAQLDFARSLAGPATHRLALLTGQSSFRSSLLTSAQRDFLHAVAPPGCCVLDAAFPYHPDLATPEPAPGLLAASLRNALQFHWTLTSPAYRRGLARALEPLFARTSERLDLLTGSCGLQMLAAAWPLLPATPRTLRVIALGPVLTGLEAAFPHLAIQGRRDSWSRALYRGPAPIPCRCGHLDYWTSPEVRGLTAQRLQ